MVLQGRFASGVRKRSLALTPTVLPAEGRKGFGARERLRQGRGYSGLVSAVLPRAVHSARLGEVQSRQLTTTDGVDLYYEVLVADRPDAPVMLLANGLGGKLYAWEPLLERFSGLYRIITWDYRGLFRSSAPAREKDLSIPHHARDALSILDAEGVERATFVGWSMGVQVFLEAALERPERIERLILLNGTSGQIFQSGLQPVTRVPGLPRLMHRIVEHLSAPDSRIAGWIKAIAQSETHLRVVGWTLSRLFKNPRLEDMYRQYNVDVFGESFSTYLRLFQELDAHSVYHLLGRITQPTLVISGGLDWLTPPGLSYAIAQRIPGAEHLHLRLGSHFVLIEHSARVLGRIESFLEF